MDPRLEQVPVAGGTMAVDVHDGSNPQVVLAFHGGTSCRAVWGPVVRALGGDVAVVAPDLRGWASSSVLPGPYGMAAHADDARRVLDHLGLERVVVTGWSLGGFVAANVAEALGDRATALVLIDGGIGLAMPEGFDPWPVLDQLIAPVTERLASPPPSLAAHRDAWRTHPAFARRGLWDDEIQTVMESEVEVLADGSVRHRVPLESIRTDVAETLAAPTRDAVDRAPCPVTFVWAERGLADEPVGYYSHDLAVSATGRLGARLVEAWDLNHYELVLHPDGASIVAAAIRAALPTP
jgi:pimeloyl-ACP methyl ester carboxylesterase